MIDDFHAIQPYSLNEQDKTALLTKELIELTCFHNERCEKYSNLLKAFGYDETKVKTYCDIPFFPVRMLKYTDLISIDRKDIFKTMTSSGTTGQAVSKIFLDKQTALLQQKVLIRLLGDYIGKKRLPALIIDTSEVTRNRSLFSVRGGTIMALSVAAREMVYALNEDMSLNIEAVQDFLKKYGDTDFLVFGFTFLIWQHLYKEVKAQKLSLDFKNAYLLQGGGWKKLLSEAVDRKEYKKRMRDLLGTERFTDHYGMSEQTGCIYLECEYGHFHASIYSDVIVRRHTDFSVCDIGEKGIIQVVSVLPRSYPGHSLLTEDEGTVLGVDDCPCGRLGKYIEIAGRIKSAELRGCSDTYADKFK